MKIKKLVLIFTLSCNVLSAAEKNTQKTVTWNLPDNPDHKEIGPTFPSYVKQLYFDYQCLLIQWQKNRTRKSRYQYKPLQPDLKQLEKLLPVIQKFMNNRIDGKSISRQKESSFIKILEKYRKNAQILNQKYINYYKFFNRHTKQQTTFIETTLKFYSKFTEIEQNERNRLINNFFEILDKLPGTLKTDKDSIIAQFDESNYQEVFGSLRE